MPPTTFPPNIDIISQPHQDTSPVHVGIGIPKHLHPPPFLICVRFVWTCCSVCLSLHPLSSSTTNPVISRRGENSSQLMLKEAFVTLWSPHLPLALLTARDYGLAFTCPYVILNMNFCTLKPSLVSVSLFIWLYVLSCACAYWLKDQLSQSNNPWRINTTHVLWPHTLILWMKATVLKMSHRDNMLMNILVGICWPRAVCVPLIYTWFTYSFLERGNSDKTNQGHLVLSSSFIKTIYKLNTFFIVKRV